MLNEYYYLGMNYLVVSNGNVYSVGRYIRSKENKMVSKKGKMVYTGQILDTLIHYSTVVWGAIVD